MSEMATSVNDSFMLSTGMQLGQTFAKQVLRPSSGAFGPRLIAASIFIFVILVVIFYTVRQVDQTSKRMEIRAETRVMQPSGQGSPVSAGQLVLTAPKEVEAQERAREKEKAEAAASWQLVLFFAVGHCLSASMLTIANKWAMNEFHPVLVSGGHSRVYVWTLTTIQFLFAALVTKIGGLIGVITVEPLVFRKCLAFFPAAGMFMITIVAGNAVMNYSSVNAFLILRALVPLPVALAEALVYGDPCPPWKSWMALLVIVGGSVAYALVVGGLELHSVSWAVMFLVLMPVDAIVIKHSISASGLKPWSLVYYNNILAAMPCAFFVFIFELQGPAAWSEMLKVLLSPQPRVAVMCSCLLGLSISFFQLNTRYYISATAFMVLGVVNKFITVLVNQAILDRQGAAATASVCICLLGAVLWQQSVAGDAIKTRPKSASWEQYAGVPFMCTVVALTWAGIVEWQTLSG